MSLLVLGCTRNSPSNSDVRFEIPTYAQLQAAKKTSGAFVAKNAVNSSVTVADTAATETHVIINVQGEGIAVPIFCSYDSGKDSNPTTIGPCSFISSGGAISVSLSVPAGNNRLVQVLLAYEGVGASSNGLHVYYGDRDANMTPGNADIAISVDPLTAAPVRAGHVRGRYFKPGGGTLTGLVEARIKANANRPAMTLMRGEAIAGWFESFVFSEIDVEMWVAGELLFGRPVRLDYFASLDANKVHIKTDTNGTDVIGFFGDQAAIGTRSVCSVGCVGNEFVDYLRPNSWWRGPFLGGLTVNSVATANLPAGSMSWKLLPSVEPEIEGIRIYKKSDVTEAFVRRFSLSENTFNCALLRQELGSSLPTVTVQASSTSALLPGGSFNSSTEMLVLCPFKGGREYTSALLYPDTRSGGGGGPYFRLELMNAGWNSTLQHYEVMRDICYRVDLKAFTQGGGEGQQSPPFVNGGSAAWSAVPGINGTWGGFYQDSTCTTQAASPSYSVPVGQSSSAVPLYLKLAATAVNGSAYEFTLTGFPSELSFGASYNKVSVVQPGLMISGTDQLGINICHPFTVNYVNQSGQSMNLPGGVPLTLDITNSTGTTQTVYPSYNTCISGSGSQQPNIAIGMASTRFFYKKSTGPFSLKATSALTTNSNLIAGGVTSQSDSATKISIEMRSSDFGWDSCLSAEAIAKNEVGSEVAVREPTTFKLAISAPYVFRRFNDAMCASPNPSPLSISAGESRTQFFFKVDGSASATPVTFTFLSDSVKFPVAGSFTSVLPSDRAFVRPMLPSFNSRVIGSHEFNDAGQVYRTVPLLVSAGASVALECYDAGSYGTCTGAMSSLVGTTLRWSLSDIQASRKLRLTATKSGAPNGIYVLDPMIDPQQPLKVLACDAVLTSNGSFFSVGDASVVPGSTAVIQAGKTLCVAANVTVTESTTTTLLTGSAVVGWSDLTSHIAQSSSANILYAGIGAVTLANLKMFYSAAPTGSPAMITLNGISAGDSIFDNLKLDASNASNTLMGFNLANLSAPHTLSASRIEMLIASNASFMSVYNSSTIPQLKGVKIKSSAAPANPAMGFDIALSGFSSDVSVNVSELEVSDTSGTGPGVLILKAGAGQSPYLSRLQITNSKIRTANSSSSAPVVSLGAYTRLELHESVFETNATQPAIVITNPKAQIDLRKNTLVQRSDNNFLRISRSSGSGVQDPTSFSQNDFIRASGGSNSSAAVQVDSAYMAAGDVYFLGNGETAAFAGNRFCGETGAITWNAALFESGSAVNASSDFNLATVSLSTSVSDNGVLRCK